jgi:hypothetical protein
MIAALPTASFSLSIPRQPVSSVGGARSMFAPTILTATKVVSGYSGGGGASPTPDAVTAADISPPAVQAYPVQATAAATPGAMSMAAKVGIFAGIVAVVGVGIVIATKRR